MIRLIARTDAHLSDRSPASRTDVWADTVLDKLAQTGKLAEHVGAAAILDNGDFFHIKSPSRNSHELVQRVAELHRGFSCPTYANVGNHDCVYGDYEYLGQQPLGVLFSSGVFQRCYDEHEVTFTDGEIKVRVVGIPYHGDRYDMERFTSIKKGEEDYLVVMAHVLASSKGGQMFENEDIIKYADLAGLDPDLWYFGHWHKDQGIERIGDKWFVNLGSMTRGALTQDNVDRKPKVALMQFSQEGLSVREVALRIQPAEEVFDVEARVRAEARDMTMDAFVETLQSALVEKNNAEPLEEVVANMEGLPRKVRERTILYLERAT